MRLNPKRQITTEVSHGIQEKCASTQTPAVFYHRTWAVYIVVSCRMRCLALLSLLLLAGCATDYSWCTPGEAETPASCRYDLSRKEWLATKREWHAAATEEAERLPVNYNEIVLAIYKPKNGEGGSFCLEVFGSEPSAELLASLRGAGVNPRQCAGRHVTYTYVQRISQQPEGLFRVVTGYYCGELCAAEHVLMVERDNDGAFKVVKEELL